MKEKPYPTDLTDAQWQAIEPCFINYRNRKWDKRELVNAVLYIANGVCYPMTFTLFNGVELLSQSLPIRFMGQNFIELGSKKRLINNRQAIPTYTIIDSQSVKTAAFAHDKGFDGGKRSKVVNVILS